MIEKHEHRFLKRVFTPLEILHCSSQRNVTEIYTQSWAVKEAVAKAIGMPRTEPKRWLEIEIRYGLDPQPSVHLEGNAASRAVMQSIDQVLVSVSSTRHFAVAFATALG
jgi:holo-[acyl-carrier protein] synthase